MTVQFDQVVFAYSMEEVYSVGATRFLRDRGPNQFDMQLPGGAADPVPQLDGSLYFNGAPQYLSLPVGQLARFYTQLSTGTMTVFVSYRADVSGALWSNWNSAGGGVNKGITLLAQTTAAVSPRLYQFQGGAPQPYLIGSVACGLGRKNILSYTMEGTPRGLTNQTTNGAAWAVGAFGVTVHDTAIVPRIGSYPSGASPFQGTINYLAFVRDALSSSDLSLYSRLLSEGIKPWTVR